MFHFRPRLFLHPTLSRRFTHGEIRHPLAAQPSIQVSSPTEEVSKPPISMPKVRNLTEKTVLPRPPYVPPEPGLTADGPTPSRAKHQARAVTRNLTNPTTPHSSEMPPAATTPAGPLPVSVRLLNGPDRTFSEKNVPAQIHSRNSADGTRRSASTSRPVTTDPAAMFNSRSDPLQATNEAPVMKFATVMKSQPPGPARETTIPRHPPEIKSEQSSRTSGAFKRGS